MSRAAYLLTLAMLILFWLLAPSGAVLAAMAVLLLLPMLSWGMLRFARRKLRLEISAPATAQKGRLVPVSVRLQNPGRLSAGYLELTVTVENSVTGQKIRRKLSGPEITDWKIESEFCGCLTICVERSRLYDLFGLLWVNVKQPKEKRVVILPDTFPVLIEQDAFPAASKDAEDYAQDKKGQDRTETWQIRGYVPGDSLAQIHWKLSSKLDTLMVREPGFPVDRDLMVFVDRAWGKITPRQADAVMEAAVSVCQSLSDGAVPYQLVWNEESIRSQEVTEEDQLSEAVGALLKSKLQQVPGTEVYQNLYGPPGVSRVIYIGTAVPDSLEAFGANTRMVCLLCSELPDMDGVICFTPETVSEALAQVYWS